MNAPSFNQPPLPGIKTTPDRFVDHTLVPNPQIINPINPDIMPRPLLLSQEFWTVQSIYEHSGKKYRDKVDAAIGVAEIVRGALEWVTYKNRRALFEPNDLETSKTNCIGSTLVISETLDELGIEHYIGFADSHTFIALANKTKGRIDWVDSTWRGFDGEFSDAITNPDDISGFLADEDIVVTDTKLDMLKIFKLRRFDDTDEITKINEWVKPGDKSKNHPFNQDLRHEDYSLYLRLYKSDTGRRVLVDYTNSEVHAAQNNGEEFVNTVYSLGGLYPDVDPRFGLATAFHKVKEKIVKNKRYDLLLKIGEVAPKPLPNGDSSPNALIAPDAFRIVGAARKDPTLLTKALHVLNNMKTSTPKGRELEKRVNQDLIRLAGQSAINGAL